MKIIKIIILWIFIAGAIEVIGFSFVDKYYLATDTNFKTEVVVEPPQPRVQVPKLEIKISDNLTREYKMSDSGNYSSYIEDGTLQILNTSNGEIDVLKPENGESICFYKWIPESNKIILVKKNELQKKIKLYRYDARLKEKPEEIKNYMDGNSEGREVALTIKAPNAQVVDVDLSIYNQVTYIKLLNNGRRDEIYRIDRMGYLERINPKELKSNVIGQVNSTKHLEKLVYEDVLYGKVYATGVKNPLVPKDISKVTLLGIDSSDDTAYIGSIENELITKIFYGSVEDSVDNWKVIDLLMPLRKDQIIVSSNSRLYVNYGLEGFITDIRNNTTTTYNGRFLQVFEKGIVCINQGVMEKVNFK